MCSADHRANSSIARLAHKTHRFTKTPPRFLPGRAVPCLVASHVMRKTNIALRLFAPYILYWISGSTKFALRGFAANMRTHTHVSFVRVNKSAWHILLQTNISVHCVCVCVAPLAHVPIHVHALPDIHTSSTHRNTPYRTAAESSVNKIRPSFCPNGPSSALHRRSTPGIIDNAHTHTHIHT